MTAWTDFPRVPALPRTAAASPRTAERLHPHAETVRRLDSLARLMDSAVAIPGTNIRFGLDAALGLVPGVGDLAAKVFSAYLIYEARRVGLPTHKMMRMIGNVVLDATVGSVPLVGDVFDVFWRANLRNMRILREHLAADGKEIDLVPMRRA